ncbi:hypothetical protein BGZ76_007633, partial [Entomortierella beljakovae]
AEANRATFRKLQHTHTRKFQKHRFVAAVFLKDNIPNKARLHDQNFKFNISRDSKGMKELAAELVQAEPALRGCQPGSLFSFYNGLVTKKRDYDVFLSNATGITNGPSRFADIAADLVQLDDEIRERNDSRQAEKLGRINQAELLENNMLVRSTSGLKR